MPQQPRTIRPEDAQDERIAALPLSAAHTYAYLPTVLDDEGRAKDQPAVLNGYLWPLRSEEHPTAAMVADLAALAEAELICRYRVGGRPYLHDPRFKDRHPVTEAMRSTLAPCPEHDKGFDEAVTETLGRFADQVSTVVGSTATRLEQSRIEDSFARLVEDVTYLIDPEKAAANGQRVRGMFARLRPAGSGTSTSEDRQPDSGPASGD